MITKPVNPFERFPNAMIFLLAGIFDTIDLKIVKSFLNVKVANTALEFVVPHTAEPRKSGEVNEVDYFFTEREAFERMIAQEGYFAAYTDMDGARYGIGSREINAVAVSGGFGITHANIEIAMMLKKKFPNNIHVVLMRPPSIKKARLQFEEQLKTAQVSPIAIKARLERFDYEMQLIDRFDDVTEDVMEHHPKHMLQELSKIIAGQIYARTAGHLC